MTDLINSTGLVVDIHKDYFNSEFIHGSVIISTGAGLITLPVSDVRKYKYHQTLNVKIELNG